MFNIYFKDYYAQNRNQKIFEPNYIFKYNTNTNKTDLTIMDRFKRQFYEDTQKEYYSTAIYTGNIIKNDIVDEGLPL